jgi:hypothetical protein
VPAIGKDCYRKIYMKRAPSTLQARGFTEIEALVYCYLLTNSPVTGYRVSRGTPTALSQTPVRAAITAIAGHFNCVPQNCILQRLDSQLSLPHFRATHHRCTRQRAGIVLAHGRATARLSIRMDTVSPMRPPAVVLPNSLRLISACSENPAARRLVTMSIPILFMIVKNVTGRV